MAHTIITQQSVGQVDHAALFTKFLNENHVNRNDDQAFSRAWNTFYGGGYTSDIYAKDTVPARPSTGWVYDKGPYTWRVDTVFNSVLSGGGPLMEWIPTENMEAEEESIGHLSWVAKKGWTGQDYADFLHGLSIPTCGYGPGTSWAGWEMTVKYGKASGSTESLMHRDFGLRQHVKSPILRQRGPNGGLPMANDAEWAVARVALDMENHLAWNLLNGIEGEPLQWDGLNQILTPGYVAAHVVGPQKPVWASPLVYDGSSITTCEDLLEVLKAIVRFLRRRIQQRRWSVALTDMAVVMPSAMWSYILDCIACGGITGCGVAPTGYTMQDWRNERNNAAMGGVGYGVIEVDGVYVPVIPEDGMGVATQVGGQWAVTGNIAVLTRRVSGIPLWSQQFLNWNTLSAPPQADDSWTEQGGIFRVGWVSEAQKCFYYFTEVWGRMVCRLFPLQAVLSNVTITTVLPNEVESGYYGDSYYALEGATGVGTLLPWA